MASSPELVNDVGDQISGCGDVRFRKMFGEYMVYVNDKPLLLVCDNTVFVKALPGLEALMNDAPLDAPYPGAKAHYVLDIDNVDLALAVVETLEPLTPLPKPRTK
jgi:TfoX/Sxy family transcriptional regulator of competence genes